MGARQAGYVQQLRDLKLQVLERYVNTLKTYNSFLANRNILPIRQEIYRMKERLHEAGEQS